MSEVCTFLGTIGVCRIFIHNFAQHVAPLILLTRKDVLFEFGPEQIALHEDLKQALINSPAIHAIDYTFPSPIILAVDTSNIAIGFFLCQCNIDNPRKCFYNRFSLITLNDRELRFSQPKLKLYGLYRMLGLLCLYLINVRNLIVEVDARYIKGMLTNPDIAPSASINRWIILILTFQFKLIHVAGTHHGPDGLSRRPAQEGNEADSSEEPFEDWINNFHGFVHQINPIPLPQKLTITCSIFIQSQDLSEEDAISYDAIPHSAATQADNHQLLKVQKWLNNLKHPADLSDTEYKTFV